MSKNENESGDGTSSDSTHATTAKPSQKPASSIPAKPEGPPNTDFRTLWVKRSRETKVDEGEG